MTDDAAVAETPDPEKARLDRFRSAAAAAERWLPGMRPRPPADALRGLVDAAADETDLEWDRYGDGGPVAAVEQEVAELLGKPAAAMFPSGTMAQQCMLRVWTDRAGSRRVALPAQSHLLHHELDGPRLLHGFQFELLSDGPRVPTVADVTNTPGKLGACLLELPLRDAGYLLPTWDELTAFSTACRARGVALHFDGARVWESAPYLGHSLAEIADLADSVYVSFYKGLRGLAGAALAGPTDAIDEALQWRQRMGGTVFTMLPYAVAALRGLRDELPQMPAYHDRAVALATAFQAAGIEVFPQPPHTNAFRILVDDDHDAIIDRLTKFMETDGISVSPPWGHSDVPGWSWTEFTVGPATLEWSIEEAVEVLSRALGRGDAF